MFFTPSIFHIRYTSTSICLIHLLFLSASYNLLYINKELFLYQSIFMALRKSLN
nr:hypothetical protein [uncultured bacterium]